MSEQLNHPESWTTGDDKPTEKQTAFLATLAKQKGVEVEANNLNKSDTSAKIDELKNMTDSSGQGTNTTAPASAPIQDPESWSTGGDSATGKQTGYIAVMAKQAGEDPPKADMSKTEASEKIEELKKKTGM
ncbi:hypothetical protein KC340_g2721 [Hortaea werneckii]|nr:hypothetical protein KC342_g2776 [Hortaea werneckii]KAI7099494.1 hypothetical protein KC339_g8164 [Hortaea werneckii]KAI7242535.1 hypothetical protein KC365_g3085 [Hortaea werneckii]KAI7333769.1 hypothetical protein KC340_g2721 [Hortaea werneckii]KAI7387874.1 hypothetical protein KC328_g9240 [Hortaea werneckii]